MIVKRARDIDFQELERHSAAIRALVDAILGRLSPDECADVETIFYTGRNREYGEHYERYLGDMVRKYGFDADRRWEYVKHVVSKTNLLDGLISGLRRVGRPSLAERLSGLPALARSAEAGPTG